MSLVRWILARIIFVIDFLFAPKGLKRNPQEQAELDKKTAKLALYQYAACPFCVKVRWVMQRHSLNIETRDAKREPKYAEELLVGGGSMQVPCLRIEDDKGLETWLYESADIIAYLERSFDLQMKTA